MAVHRVICRWDFTFRAMLMDRPGEVYEAIGGDSWPELQENTSHAYTVKKSEEGGSVYRTVSFAPNFIAFSIEWRKGLSASKVMDNERFLELLRTLDKIKGLAGVSVLKRAGLRFFDIDQILQADEVAPAIDAGVNARPLLNHFIGEACANLPLSATISQSVGEATDVSWRQTGNHPDGGRYFVTCGPFGNDEKPKYFESIHNDWDEKLPGDFISDSDFADENFELKAAAKSWASPLVDRHAKLLIAIKRTIRGGK